MCEINFRLTFNLGFVFVDSDKNSLIRINYSIKNPLFTGVSFLSGFAKALAFLFVTDSQFLSALGSTSSEYSATILRLHASTKTMRFCTFTLFWLIGSFCCHTEDSK